MKNTTFRRTSTSGKVIIRRCHRCGHLSESVSEIKKCSSCKKSFLPVNYFYQIDTPVYDQDYEDLFLSVDEINEEEMVKGLCVIW